MARKAKTIQTMWDNVFKASDKLAERIHKLAVETLNHYREHGDTSLMAYAINGLQKRGTNRRALIQWFTRHAKVNLVVVDNQVKFVKREKVDHTKTDVDKAAASPFYEDDSADGRTGDDLKSFNLFGRVRSAIKKEKELKAQVDSTMRTENVDQTTALKKLGYDPEKTTIVENDILDKMEGFIESYGNLDKPQTKADSQRTVFKGNHGPDNTLREVG